MAYRIEFSALTRLFGLVLLLSIVLGGCGAHVYHQVRKNDTLYSISWHYNQDFQQLAKWNNLQAPYTINEGQWLRVAPPGVAAGLQPPIYAKADQRQGVSRSAGYKPDVTSGHSNSNGSAAANTYSEINKWIWPVKGKVIQKFSADQPGKQGLDISAAAGTLVNAAAAGKVVYSGNGLRGYGNLIIIKHNEEFLSAYAHNQSIIVKEGAVVEQGQPIARVGNTESSQVKLHFQIRVNGKPVDPLRYLPM